MKIIFKHVKFSYKAKKKKKKLIKHLKLFNIFNINLLSKNIIQRQFLFNIKSVKKKKKKVILLRKQYLNFHRYRLVKKKAKINFINFFEKNENELLQQKKFSSFLVNYNLNRNLSWFTDFHDYTFFHKYFILKRDRFWYSAVRDEYIYRYNESKNMLLDSWEENFSLQQKSIMFIKEQDNSFFYLRNCSINSLPIRFLGILKETVLKKHFLYILFKSYFLLFFFSNFFLFFCFCFNLYFLIFINTLLVMLYPFIIFLILKYFSYKFKFFKFCILLSLKKPYIYQFKTILFLKYIYFFFRQFINLFFYQNNLIIKNLYILSRLGWFYNIKYINLINNLSWFKKFIICLINCFLNSVLFLIYNFIFNKYFLLYYNFFFFVENYLMFFFIIIILLTFLTNKIILNFLVLFSFNNKNFMNFLLSKNNFLKNYFFFKIVKIYFNNDCNKSLIFIDQLLFCNNKNNKFVRTFNFDELFEYFSFLQQTKALQYINSYKKLKSYAF